MEGQEKLGGGADGGDSNRSQAANRPDEELPYDAIGVPDSRQHKLSGNRKAHKATSVDDLIFSSTAKRDRDSSIESDEPHKRRRRMSLVTQSMEAIELLSDDEIPSAHLPSLSPSLSSSSSSSSIAAPNRHEIIEISDDGNDAPSGKVTNTTTKLPLLDRAPASSRYNLRSKGYAPVFGEESGPSATLGPQGIQARRPGSSIGQRIKELRRQGIRATGQPVKGLVGKLRSVQPVQVKLSKAEKPGNMRERKELKQLKKCQQGNNRPHKFFVGSLISLE
jgi:hypothetical protein